MAQNSLYVIVHIPKEPGASVILSKPLWALQSCVAQPGLSSSWSRAGLVGWTAPFHSSSLESGRLAKPHSSLSDARSTARQDLLTPRLAHINLSFQGQSKPHDWPQSQWVEEYTACYNRRNCKVTFKRCGYEKEWRLGVFLRLAMYRVDSPLLLWCQPCAACSSISSLLQCNKSPRISSWKHYCYLLILHSWRNWAKSGLFISVLGIVSETC